MKLSDDFYRREDVVLIAKELLGKFLYTRINGIVTGGMIVETEAYRGPEDRGSHAYNGRRTPRNETMYAAGGHVYMYICYGIHDMLNIVTGQEGTSHAVLIRAVDPTEGIDIMRERRNIFGNDSQLCKGPGALAKALGLAKIHNGTSLHGSEIWIEDRNVNYSEDQIIASPRIGMNFAGPYKTIPWRFYVKGNKNVSGKKYTSVNEAAES
ncbi:DNA-3-methyladenine glycosylase [Pedobacter sp. HMF7647]|uniref:Putative 3-methyladenine DNA glycosylase n=1 Tax=Hufsiella arboris TaxID=2695275 RepID=A0A7K1Y7E8_9SPHI|nr:DNA-3-methyladenine glycosylase [Hufsiella arboris]MXV50487.1 DNA-3-methyladenine glycosylase [Hufsiella arboris]